MPSGLGGLAVSARFGKDGAPIGSGLLWRVYGEKPEADGSFKQAFWLWGPGIISGCTEAGTVCQRRALGRGLVGGFDFNGDGKQDVGVLRNNGFELFLGRTPDDTSLAKLSMGCDPVYSA